MGFRKLNGPATAILRVFQFGAYAAFRVGAFLLSLIPLGLCFWVGRIAGHLGYFFDREHRRIALKNFAIAYGDELDEKTRRKMARECFANVGSNILCSLKLPLMKEADIVARVEVEGSEHPQAAATLGKGIIYAIPHSGNWELLSQVPSLVAYGFKTGALFQPLGNPFLNAYVERTRKLRGYDLFDRHRGFTAPTGFIREGGAIGVLVDQHAGDSGIWCPFFGRLASTTNLAALLGKRTKAPIVPLAVHTVGHARWKLVFGKPLAPQGKTEQITADLNVNIENLIRLSPTDWFWVHNRWKTPHPKFLLESYRRGITLPTGFTTSQLKPFHIMVRSPNWLGDACMAIPTVRAIKNGRPDAHITVLTPERWAPLWRRVPEVSDVVTKEDGQSPSSVRKKLLAHRARYDAVVLLPNSLRAALEVRKLGADRVAGFAGHNRRRFVGTIVSEQPDRTPPEHHARRYLRIAQRVGAKLQSSYPVPYLEAPVRAALTPDQQFQIGICPGAAYGPTKRLPASIYLAACKLLATRFPTATFVVFGTGEDQKAAKVIEEGLGSRCENLIGKTDLDGLIDRLALCHTLVTNDTGTMHLAASIGVPTVPIFGSTEPLLTSPLGHGHAIVRNHIDCSPCFLRECPRGDYECLRSVTPEQVANTALQVLQRMSATAPPSAAPAAQTTV